MNEFEMLEALRDILSAAVDGNGGIREIQKAELRQEIVDTVAERFGAGTWDTLNAEREP